MHALTFHALKWLRLIRHAHIRQPPVLLQKNLVKRLVPPHLEVMWQEILHKRTETIIEQTSVDHNGCPFGLRVHLAVFGCATFHFNEFMIRRRPLQRRFAGASAHKHLMFCIVIFFDLEWQQWKIFESIVPSTFVTFAEPAFPSYHGYRCDVSIFESSQWIHGGNGQSRNWHRWTQYRMQEGNQTATHRHPRPVRIIAVPSTFCTVSAVVTVSSPPPTPNSQVSVV